MNKGLKLNLTMGARNNAKTEREPNDFYATHPQAVKDFLETLKKDGIKLSNKIWECACGKGHMAEVFKEYGHFVLATDLIDRGYGKAGVDFLEANKEQAKEYDILTNPPFSLATEFAYKGNQIISKGAKLGLFLKIQFLETKQRRVLFETYPPKYVYVYSQRQHCASNGEFEKYKAKTQCYCWVIWEGGFKGETILRFI